MTSQEDRIFSVILSGGLAERRIYAKRFNRECVLNAISPDLRVPERNLWYLASRTSTRLNDGRVEPCSRV
jgi:hypothetical protein